MDEKMQEMNSWILEHRLWCKADERARRKAAKDEARRAMYQQQQQQEPQNCPSLTSKAVNVLLDSGVLRAGDIGKLCLTTAKSFLSDLHMDYDFVWKKIFEAKFNDSSSFNALYQNPSFNLLLDQKGYEWMFRSFFGRTGRKRVDEDDFKFLSKEEKREWKELKELRERFLQGPRRPAAALNGQNFFFVALFEKKDRHGNLKTIHAAVLDTEVQESHPVTYRNQVLGHEDISRYQVLIPSDVTFDHIEAAQVSLLAFRTDTGDRAFLCNICPFQESYQDTTLVPSLVSNRNYIPLNAMGRDMASSCLIKAENGNLKLEEDPYLEARVSIHKSGTLELVFMASHLNWHYATVSGDDLHRLVHYGTHCWC